MHRTLALAPVLTCLLLGMTCDLALARTRQTTVTGPQGQTASRSINRERGQVSSTTTLPNGQTASRQVSRQDGQANATVSGPNGQTFNRTTTITP